jgi:PleD family two-component response regulator
MWSEQEKKSEKSIQVVHVDDDIDTLIISKINIEKFEPLIQVTSLLNAMDVLNQIKSWDCIVLDYDMPEIDGLTLATKIREISDTPIILYTGKGSDELASAAFEVGVDDYILKEYGTSHYQALSKRIIQFVEKKDLKGQ